MARMKTSAMRLAGSSLMASMLAHLLLPSAAMAAPPDIGEALRQAAPTGIPPRPAPALPELGGATEPPLKALSGEKVLVKEFRIAGNSAIPTAELLGIVAPFAGKELSLSEIEEIASLITKHYRSKGYFVARAYVPAQEVTGGTVLLRIIEGSYGSFQLQNKSLVDDDVVQGLLDDIKDRDIVSTETIERAMLIINDTPGVAVTRADVAPGEKVGTSDFVIGTDATQRFSGYALVDNYGSRYTGKNKVSFGVDVNSPFGLGDRLTLAGMQSNTQGLQNGRLAYSSLLSSGGLRGEVSVARTTYELADIYKSLDAVGRADAIEAALTYPIKRTRLANLEGSVSVASKSTLDEIRSTSTRTPKKIRVATLGLKSSADHLLFGLAGTSLVQGSLTFGHLAFEDDAAGRLDAAGANTQGNFRKVNALLARNTLFTQNLSLAASLKLQKALGKNLDGSERMTISGSTGVKAYPAGEVAGENAYLGSLELLYALPMIDQLRPSVGLFANSGRASMEHQVGTALPRRLSDVGIGFYGNIDRFNFRLQVARRSGGTPATSESVRSPNVLLQVGYFF